MLKNKLGGKAVVITGDILLGSGNDTVAILAGSVIGDIDFGAAGTVDLDRGAERERAGETAIGLGRAAGACFGRWQVRAVGHRRRERR